jgi:hypothetical protein
MHLRPPSIDHGLASFLWAFFLSLYLWLGMLAIGVDGATAIIVSALSFCAIFFFVRLRGEDEFVTPGSRPRPRSGDESGQARRSADRPR